RANFGLGKIRAIVRYARTGARARAAPLPPLQRRGNEHASRRGGVPPPGHAPAALAVARGRRTERATGDRALVPPALVTGGVPGGAPRSRHRSRRDSALA